MGKRNLESSDGWERCKADRGQKPDRSQKGWEKGTDLGSKGHTPEGPGAPKFYYDNVCIV